jgi:D-3-phosphoglycerate dehydrogenase
MSKVYITDEIDVPDIEKNILGDNVSTECDYQAKVLMAWNTIIDKDYIDQFPHLTSIIRCGIGYDLIDTNYAKSRNIAVSNVPDYCIHEVADTTIGFILNIIRGISAMDAICRKIPYDSSRHLNTWQQQLLKQIKRTSVHTVGIIGAGRIGLNVMEKLTAIGVTCIYFDPFITNEQASKIRYKKISTLDEVLSRSDIISLHTPLTEQTRGMVNKQFIDKMKPGASLVNTARGKIIADLDIIYHALTSHHLFSVGFDVLPEEPPAINKFIMNWQSKACSLDGRILVNPHAAFYSQQSYIEVREKASLNALRVLSGKTQLHVVN